MGPVSAIMVSDDPADARFRPLLFVMVENRAGLDAVDQIAAIDGIDGIYVGVKDLDLSLTSEPSSGAASLDDAIAHILATARAHGKIAAIGTGSAEDAQKRRAQGFTFITTAIDLLTARRAFARALTAAKAD